MKKIILKKNSLDSYRKDSGSSHHSLLANYLMTLGIKEENVNKFINHPDINDLDDPWKLKNMDIAVNAAKTILDSGKANIFIQVDSDTDGWTSSAILIQYLRKRYPFAPLQYSLHPGKEHGIDLNTIPEAANLIFIPDAGSNDFEEQEELINQGKTVIVLDHHHMSNQPNSGAIIVNNQISPLFSNKSMSGAGVTYMFVKALDQQYEDPLLKNKEYMDLAAVGIIADAMTMTTLGNNFLAYNGLQEMKNKFLRALAIHQARGIPDVDWLTKTDVAFYIAPVINGVIRSGSQEDKAIVFSALCTEDSNAIYESEYRGKIRKENLYDYAVRLASNAKSRQDNAKKKGFDFLCEKIQKEHLNDNNLMIIALNSLEEKKVTQNITGLIAMELVKQFNRPCLLVRKTTLNGQELFGGSGRNGNFYFLPSLLKFLHESGRITYAEGHDNAFGIFLTEAQIKELVNYANEKIDSSLFEDEVFEVDAWFKADLSSDEQDILMQFAAADKLWGNGIPKPTFAFTTVGEKADFFLMGADKTSVRYKNMFVCFKNKELADQITALGMKDKVEVTIIGTPLINE